MDILKLKKINVTSISHLFFLNDVEIEKVLVSKKIFFVKKRYKSFNGYFYNNHKVKPLHIMLHKTSEFVKSYDGQTKWRYFFMEDDDILEKYNTLWDKVRADIKKEYDGEPVDEKKILKTKIKSYCDEVTDYYDKEIPKVDSNHTSLAVISFDSALEKDENENYFPELILKEYKYITYYWWLRKFFWWFW